MECMTCHSDKFFGREVIVASGRPSEKWLTVRWCSQCDEDAIVRALPEAFRCTLCGCLYDTCEASVDCCKYHVVSPQRAFPDYRVVTPDKNVSEIARKKSMRGNQRVKATENGKKTAQRWNRQDSHSVIQARIQAEKDKADE